MACWLEPHWRSTVVAGTDSGKPAARTALRPTLKACSPTCPTQPAITSSIRAGSSLLRATRPLSVKPRRSTGCQDFSMPSRRPSGVRTASTITASLFILSLLLQPAYAVLTDSEFFCLVARGSARGRPRHSSWAQTSCGGARFLIEVSEAFAFFGQTLEQRRRLPEFSVLLMKFADAVVNFFQADCVRIPHGTAAVRGETIAGEIDDVDIDGAERVAFFQDARAFVHQCIDQAIDNFFLGDGVLLHASLSRPFAHVFFHGGIRDGAAVLIIFVPAGAGLLTVTPHFAEPIFGQRLADAGLFQVLKFLANAPADVESSKIADGERTHGHSVIVHRFVDSFDARAFFHQELRFTAVRAKHAVADKSSAIPHQHANLAQLFGQMHARGDHFFA